MALSSTRLAAAIKARLLAITGFQDNAATDNFATALAEEIVTEITTNASVSTSVSVTSVSGVTTGAGVSGPGSGSGSGTIT